MLRRCASFVAPLFLLLVLAVVPVLGQEEESEDLLPALSIGSARLVRDGRELPLPMTETVLGPLFSLPDLMQALGGELRKGPLGQSFHMQLFDEQVVIGVGSHVMTVGQDIVRLSQPPRLGAGGLQVPLDLVTKTLGQALHYDFIWSQEDLRLFAMPQQAHDVDVAWNLVHLQGISTLVVQFSERPRYRIEEGDTFVLVELLGGERAVVSERRPPVDPLIGGIFFEGSAIRIRKTPGAIVEHYEQDRPFRLVFDLYQRQETRALPGSTPTSTRRLIVLDPGHGGSETGAIGPSGVEEKALTLQIARTLARRLETRLPVRVVLTRDEDADLAHDRRTAIANQQQADLFISIHLNSSVGSRAQGAETYFSSLEATDAAAAAAAHTENSSDLESDEALADLQLILWDLSQSRYLTQSQRLGTLVQGELNQALGLKDRGVKQAPFRVLLGAAMPAVLVELGFISNPEEETKLRRVSYQAELVDALVRAVSRFYGEEEAANSGSPSSTSTSSSEVP